MSISVGTPLVSSAPAVTYTLSIPAASAGDIILILGQTDTHSTSLAVAGYTAVITDAPSTLNRSVIALAKVAGSSEPTSVTITTSNNPLSINAVAYVIPGPYSDLTGVEVQTVYHNGAETPPFQPPPITPTVSASSYHYIVEVASDVTSGFTAVPTGYTKGDLSYNTSVSPPMSFGTAYKDSTNTTETPGAFTAGSSASSGAATISIPVATASSGPANGIPSLTVENKSGTPLAAGTSVSVTVDTTTGTNVYPKTANTITAANQIPVIDLSSAVTAGTIANGDTANYRVDYGGETTIVPQTVVASPT